MGGGLGALSAAALLARRSFRVLSVGDGHKAATYVYDGITLARRPFTFLPATSPAWTKVVVELACSQSWKRKVTPRDPMFQILGADLRLDVPPDKALFAQELEREMPGVKRAVEEVYQGLAE